MITLLHETNEWYVFLYKKEHHEFVMLVDKEKLDCPKSYNSRVGDFLTPDGLLELQNGSFLTDQIRKFLEEPGENSD